MDFSDAGTAQIFGRLFNPIPTRGGGVDSAHPLLKCGFLKKSFIIKNFLRNPHFSGTPMFFTFRHHWITGVSSLGVPKDCGISINPIATRGERLCLPNDSGTPRFSNLPKAPD